MLTHALPFISSQSSMVWRLFPMTYHALPSNLYKKMYIFFLKQLRVNVVTRWEGERGNPLQIVLKPCQTEKKSMVTCVVTSWSFGNTFHYDLLRLNWEKMYGNACGNACGKALKLWYRAALWALHVTQVFPASWCR